MKKFESGKETIYIDGTRNGYSPEQCGRTMTVGDLIEFLSEYDENTPIFLRNDGGYTYGNITWDNSRQDSHRNYKGAERGSIMTGLIFPTATELKQIRNQYPAGCRVRLDKMDDFQAPPIGTEGTVYGTDDCGDILVRWDTGSKLNVLWKEDVCTRMEDEE